MGTPEYAAVSLRRLLATRHRVLAVVTRPDKPRGRGQQTEASPVKRVAAEAGIEALEPTRLGDPDFLERLRGFAADLGVVVAYGRILPRAALDAPRLGCINAHASLLPQLRGAAPIERAILAGMTESGVTIMQMNEALDEGDILLMRPAPIPATMTGAELREVLAAISAELLVEAVDRFASHELAATAPAFESRPQDHARATFAPPLRKAEAAIHWGEDAGVLALRVRAFAPRPGAYAFEGKVRLKILEARALDRIHDAAPGSVLGSSDSGVAVACGRGVLEIAALQPEGRRAMTALDYERGLRTAAGTPATAAARILHDGN
jgi:methionyl-tRNA formyltransferase